MIQIRCGVAVLCTVSEPAGPGGEPTVFHVYKENFNYRTETDYDGDDAIHKSFYVANYGGWVKDAYEAAVRCAYAYAIERIVDELSLEKETVA